MFSNDYLVFHAMTSFRRKSSVLLLCRLGAFSHNGSDSLFGWLRGGFFSLQLKGVSLGLFITQSSLFYFKGFKGGRNARA